MLKSPESRGSRGFSCSRSYLHSATLPSFPLFPRIKIDDCKRRDIGGDGSGKRGFKSCLRGCDKELRTHRLGGDEVGDAFLNLFYEYVELLLFGLASTACSRLMEMEEQA